MKSLYYPADIQLPCRQKRATLATHTKLWPRLMLMPTTLAMPTNTKGEFLMWFRSKESTSQLRRCGFYPWLGRSPGGGNGNPLQYSCLENPMDKGAWWGRKNSDMTDQLTLPPFSLLYVLGWPKSLFHNILWENLNELSVQAIYIYIFFGGWGGMGQNITYSNCKYVTFENTTFMTVY